MNPATVTALCGQIAAVRALLGADDADECLREDMIEGETDADVILSRITARLRFVEAIEDGANKAAQAMKDRAARFGKEGDALRSMLRTILEAEGIKKRVLPEATISLSAPRRSLHLADDFTPPQGYARTKIEPDKAAIKAALEAGETMDGAELVLGLPIVTVR